MLTPGGPALRLTAFGAARAKRGADLLAAAGCALDQTLAQLPTARDVPLLIFSGAYFTAAPEEEPWNQARGALLDNHYSARVVGDLLLARGMPSALIHGVLLAEDAPLLRGVQAACSFVCAEGHDRLLLVAIEPPLAAASALVLAKGDTGIGLLALDNITSPTSGTAGGDLVDRIEALRKFEHHTSGDRSFSVAEGKWLARFAAGRQLAARREDEAQ